MTMNIQDAKRMKKKINQKIQVINGERITFNFNSSAYEGKQKYRYKIPELDNTWSQTSYSNFIEYIPSKSGNFTFEVQSIDRDLNYSSIGKFKFVAYNSYDF